MSERVSPEAATGDPETIEGGLEPFQSSPEFRGPVEPLHSYEHAHANNRFALIYESREEQFAAAISFIRHGLERDERCLYVIDENSKEDVFDAMRAHGVDVDTALESGSSQSTRTRGDITGTERSIPRHCLVEHLLSRSASV